MRSTAKGYSSHSWFFDAFEVSVDGVDVVVLDEPVKAIILRMEESKQVCKMQEIT